MVVFCKTCNMFYDDEFRLTFCPHDAFLANDWPQKKFSIHHDAYLSEQAPILLPPKAPS